MKDFNGTPIVVGSRVVYATLRYKRVRLRRGIVEEIQQDGAVAWAILRHEDLDPSSGRLRLGREGETLIVVPEAAADAPNPNQQDLPL